MNAHTRPRTGAEADSLRARGYSEESIELLFSYGIRAPQHVKELSEEDRAEWEAIRRDEAEEAVLSEWVDDDVSDEQHFAEERWGLR